MHRHAYRPDPQQPALPRVLGRSLRANGDYRDVMPRIGGEGFDTECALPGARTDTGEDVGGTA